MKDYDVRIDGYRYTRIQELGFILLGFILGIPGILLSWAIARKKKMMECSAEGIWLGIIGWALSICCWFILTATGVLAASTSLVALIAFGVAAVVAGMMGLTWPAAAAIDGWAIFFFVGAILFVALASMWVYGMRYKMTPQEKATPIIGDDWIKPGEKHLRYDSAVTINAPAEKVWAYVQQSGQSKAGWYSFELLERIFTFDIHNHYDIHPEWQNLQAGEFQWFHQAPLSIGEWVTEVRHEEPYGWAAHSDTATDPGYKNPGPNQEKALKLWFKRFCWTWNWEIRTISPGRCRLRWRCDCTFAPYHRLNKYLVVFILGTASIVMGRRYMDIMKRLSEGRLKYPDSKK
ncbi:MAG: hypothetical protein ACOYD7_01040 [Raoultibacter sp.]|jgi:hypothetical protein